MILLTAKGEHDDKLAGLRAAPTTTSSSRSRRASWSPASTRCCAAPTRPGGDAEPLRFDGLEIDVRARRVTPRRRGGRSSPSASSTCSRFLAAHPGQAFSRDQLMDRVWEAALYSDTSTVTVHVRRLRAKIEPDPEQPRFIQTVWGVGYRFQP